MTDRVAGFVITLESDLREDDVERIVQAIGMIRCVIDVTPVTSNAGLHMAEARARDHIRRRLLKAITE